MKLKSLSIVGAFALLANAGAAQAAVLWNNGAVVGSDGRSIIGPKETTFGYNASAAAAYAVADNFTVTGGTWTVSSLDFYSYQTNAGGYTYTSANWAVIAGTDVNAGATVASGTSALTNAGLAGYRASSTTPDSTARAIYQVNAAVVPFDLAQGDYVLAWNLSGTGTSGPWVPPVIGSTGSGNALQSTGADYVPITETGTGGTPELPFRINGTAVAAAPEPAAWGMMIVGFGAAGGTLRRTRRLRATRVAIG